MAYPYTNAPPGGENTVSHEELQVCLLIYSRIMNDFPGPWSYHGNLTMKRAAPTPEIPSRLCIYGVFHKVNGEYNLLKHSDAFPTPEAAVEDLRQKILRATFWEDPALFPVGPDYDA